MKKLKYYLKTRNKPNKVIENKNHSTLDEWFLP